MTGVTNPNPGAYMKMLQLFLKQKSNEKASYVDTQRTLKLKNKNTIWLKTGLSPQHTPHTEDDK